MGLVDLKKELIKLDKDKLIVLISDLYKSNKAAKEYLDFYANPNENDLFEKYRDKVYEAFYPKRGYSLKLSEGKKAISDFKKMSTSALLVADLMLFYVETGVQFTNEYGDIGESFYNSLQSVYSQSLMLMNKENLLSEFEDRASKILEETEGVGWGLYDSLSYAHSNFYE
jgi:Family of unknown function (DUF6155)